MEAKKTNLTEPILIILAGGCCFVPSLWIAFPAAALLVLYLPGRQWARLIPGLIENLGVHLSSVVLSITAVPVILTWTWRISNDRLIVLCVLLAICLVPWLFHRKKIDIPLPFKETGKRHRWAMIAITAYIGFCVFASHYLPQAAGRTEVTAAHDYIKHHAILLSLERHPLPLHNYFYAAEKDTPYYYYEYHYYLPTAIRKLCGDAPSIPLAFGFTSATLAIVFLCMVHALAYSFLNSRTGAIIATACASIVGGWDAIPIAIKMLYGSAPVVVLDSWILSPWRIHNLITQFMWCPQHVSAAVTLMLTAYLLHKKPGGKWWIIAAPIFGASIFGGSVYQAMVFFPAAAIYIITRLVRSRHDSKLLRREIAAIGLIALAGFALMAVQAWQYNAINERYPGGLTTSWDRMPWAFFGKALQPGVLANYLDAWWIILIDFGVGTLACFLVAKSYWSRLFNDEGMRLLTIAAIIGPLAMFTIHSSINPIDYGLRVTVIPAQIIAAITVGAALCTANVRSRIRRWSKPILITGMTLGLPVGFYELPASALRSVLKPRSAGTDVKAINYIKENTPLDAVVQGDPEKRLTLTQLTDRATGVLDPFNAHVTVFQPVSRSRMIQAFEDVQNAFRTHDSRQAHQLLSKWGVTHLLIGEVERKSFADLSQFNNDQFFHLLYNDPGACVYQLRPQAPDTKTVNETDIKQ